MRAARWLPLLCGAPFLGCDEGTGLVAGDGCSPGALECRGTAVMECGAEDRRWHVAAVCEAACVDGRCVAVPTCGNGGCDYGLTDENCANCPEECGCPAGWVCAEEACRIAPWPLCWDGICSEGEDCGVCPADCPCDRGMACRDGGCVLDPGCGDGACAAGEDCASCTPDCSCGAGTVCRGGTCVASPDPIRVAVLRSRATELPRDYVWRNLPEVWPRFGDIPIRADLTTLAVDEIAYDDLVAANADVLVVTSEYPTAPYEDHEATSVKRFLAEECRGAIGLFDVVVACPAFSQVFGMAYTGAELSFAQDYTGVLRHVAPGHPVVQGLADPFNPHPPPYLGPGGMVDVVKTLSDWRISTDADAVMVALSTDCEQVDGVYSRAGIVATTGGSLGCGRAIYLTSAKVDYSYDYEGFSATETAYRLLYNAVVWAAGRGDE